MEEPIPAGYLPKGSCSRFCVGSVGDIQNFITELTPKRDREVIDLCGKGNHLSLLKRSSALTKKGPTIDVLRQTEKLNPLKRKILSRKERKKLGLIKLPKTNWNYKSLQTIRDLWEQYMKKNLPNSLNAPDCDDPCWESFSSTLAKSELIGAEITVIRSRASTNVGISGTIVLETKNSFQVVTRESQLKCLLKEPSVFAIQIGHLRISFFGKHLMVRSSEKSVRKIKTIMKPDL